MAIVKQVSGLNWNRYLRREPLVLVSLSGLAVVFFFLVAILSRTYISQSQAKASEWYSRGVEDFQVGKSDRAADEFRVALSYWRDNYGYQISLAKALLALDRSEEAKGYLTTLWQRQPEDGTVNLELARLYAKEGNVNDALRFYHNAIYAIWDTDPEAQRRSARIELTNFLLDKKLEAQAESELIALGGNLPRDAALHAQVGDLLMKVPDYERALQQYQSSLRLSSHSAPVLAAAGRAAFDLGRYSQAARYLQQAVALNSIDETSANLLDTVRTIKKMDPDTVLPSRRAPVVLEDFRTAGARLAACMGQFTSVHEQNLGDLQNLNSQWNTMKAQVTTPRLRRDPDLADSTLELAFSIETTTNKLCGKPSGADLALLLIAKQHEGYE